MWYQILFWFILIVAALLAFWSMEGTKTFSVFTDSPMWIDIIFLLLGLNLVVVRGWNIIKRFIE